MKRLILSIFTSILLTSCVEYDIRDDGVYYIDWNEARGKAERLLPEADQNSFVPLEDDYYGKDRNFVFYKGAIIEGAEPNTFQLIEGGFAIDNKRAYYYGDSIANSSSKDFVVINGYYSKDYQNVFYCTRPLNVCSVDAFEFVYKDDSESKWERWTTDGCYYYMKEFKVPSEDYENLKLYKQSGGISSDSKYVYHLDRNIYFNKEGERILDTIDIASFTVTGYIDCKDKFGCINVYGGRKNCK